MRRGFRTKHQRVAKLCRMKDKSTVEDALQNEDCRTFNINRKKCGIGAIYSPRKTVAILGLEMQNETSQQSRKFSWCFKML